MICFVAGRRKLETAKVSWLGLSLASDNWIKGIPLDAPICSHFLAGSQDIAKFIKQVSVSVTFHSIQRESWFRSSLKTDLNKNKFFLFFGTPFFLV